MKKESNLAKRAAFGFISVISFLLPASLSAQTNITRFDEIVVEGRADDLTGTAESATQGTIGADFSFQKRVSATAIPPVAKFPAQSKA